MSYNIDTYISALNTAKTDFQNAVLGVDVRDSIVDQCDATKNLGIALNDDLNDAISQSLAVPDTTLTQVGKPAEAKATGDAVNAKADNYDCEIGNSLTVGSRASGTVGQNSVVIGTGKATANSSVALAGTATGAPSVALGTGTKASAANQTVVGKNNVEDSNGDYLFIVGNGSSDSSRSNALAVAANGNVTAAGTMTAAGKELATKEYVDSHAPTITIDATPTQGSQHAVSSGGVYDALENYHTVQWYSDLRRLQSQTEFITIGSELAYSSINSNYAGQSFIDYLNEHTRLTDSAQSIGIRVGIDDSQSESVTNAQNYTVYVQTTGQTKTRFWLVKNVRPRSTNNGLSYDLWDKVATTLPAYLVAISPTTRTVECACDTALASKYWSIVSEESALSQVAYTGDYNDLINKPSTGYPIIDSVTGTEYLITVSNGNISIVPA